ncbi:type VI secretion system-associated FHA domain protein [Caulobacter segnis]
MEFDGNNPLKFTRSADRALAQMLNRPDRGFMPSDRAVEDAFRDLQAHQMATLTAMQGALAATLDRFSPSAIRGRAENKGLLARIVPGAARCGVVAGAMSGSSRASRAVRTRPSWRSSPRSSATPTNASPPT